MADWDTIFRREGKVFHKPLEDLAAVVPLLRREKAKRILDLGCGTGRHAVMLAREGFEVHGMDASPEGIRLARAWLGKEGLKATLRVASCYEQFPFADGFFDAVVSVQVIHHNRRAAVRRCISEMARVLRPGGILFLSVPSWKRRRSVSKKSRKVAPHTYIPLEGRERGVVHFLYNRALLRQDFRAFRILDIHKDKSEHYCLLGRLKGTSE